MMILGLFDKSNDLAERLLEITFLPLFDGSSRIAISDTAFSLSIDYWHSVRVLLEAELLPPAAVLHRAQFEALTRSIWLLYSASEQQLSKLTADLSLKTEQTAKNMPSVSLMMQALEKSAPKPAYDALTRFKDHSWKALNSYVHAGIHPIRRQRDGYPVELIYNVLRNANGLGVVACMHAVVLSGQQPLQKEVLEIAGKYPDCMPPLL